MLSMSPIHPNVRSAKFIMTCQLPPDNISLDKLFYVSLDLETGQGCDKEILSEAVAAIADDRLNKSLQVELYDPGVARVSRLFSGDSLASWLIRAAALVEDRDVTDAYELAASQNLSVIEVLKQCGRLSHSDVVLVNQAEALVMEGLIYRGFAAAALKLASKQYIDFTEALTALDIHPRDPFSNSPLFLLLKRIGLVDEETLLMARREALSKGITIGWSLIKNDQVDEQLLKVLLEAIFSIRDKRIGESEVVSTAILAVSDRGMGANSPESRMVQELDLTTLDRAFGNLLLASSVIGIEELLFCAEVAISEGQSLEDVVNNFEIVEANVLNGACQLARMLSSRKISARDCTILLAKLKSTGKPLSELMNPVENQKLSESQISNPLPSFSSLQARTA